MKRPFKFRVRKFDEKAEEEAVARYCRKYAGAYGETVIKVFRNMRATLAAQQGQERETWLQVLLIGDVAIAGVPAEFFTQLGLDIKTGPPLAIPTLRNWRTTGLVISRIMKGTSSAVIRSGQAITATLSPAPGNVLLTRSWRC